FSGGSRSKSLGRQLKWPFSASETTTFLNEISSHKATVNLALSADSVRKLQLSLSKIGELSDQVTRIEETVKRIETNTLIEVDREKLRILNFMALKMILAGSVIQEALTHGHQPHSEIPRRQTL
ncbi:hypothetical protein N0V84_009940, partial [Fusarium piperis]